MHYIFILSIFFITSAFSETNIKNNGWSKPLTTWVNENSAWKDFLFKISKEDKKSYFIKNIKTKQVFLYYEPIKNWIIIPK